jgi:hypothetical protein
MRTVTIIAAVVALTAASEVRAIEHPFAVIVSTSVPQAALSRESLALIYRRRQLFWTDGTRIQPANLPAGDPLRRAFSRCVLGQSPEQTEDYWREMYFHGVLPPHVVASEQAMLLFVESTPGAVAYVSACPAGAHFAVVMTFGNVPNCPPHPTACSPLQD